MRPGRFCPTSLVLAVALFPPPPRAAADFSREQDPWRPGPWIAELRRQAGSRSVPLEESSAVAAALRSLDELAETERALEEDEVSAGRTAIETLRETLLQPAFGLPELDGRRASALLEGLARWLAAGGWEGGHLRARARAGRRPLAQRLAEPGLRDALSLESPSSALAMGPVVPIPPVPVPEPTLSPPAVRPPAPPVPVPAPRAVSAPAPAPAVLRAPPPAPGSSLPQGGALPRMPPAFTDRFAPLRATWLSRLGQLDRDGLAAGSRRATESAQGALETFLGQYLEAWGVPYGVRPARVEIVSGEEGVAYDPYNGTVRVGRDALLGDPQPLLRGMVRAGKVFSDDLALHGYWRHPAARAAIEAYAAKQVAQQFKPGHAMSDPGKPGEPIRVPAFSAELGRGLRDVLQGSLTRDGGIPPAARAKLAALAAQHAAELGPLAAPGQSPASLLEAQFLLAQARLDRLLRRAAGPLDPRAETRAHLEGWARSGFDPARQELMQGMVNARLDELDAGAVPFKAFNFGAFRAGQEAARFSGDARELKAYQAAEGALHAVRRVDASVHDANPVLARQNARALQAHWAELALLSQGLPETQRAEFDPFLMRLSVVMGRLWDAGILERSPRARGESLPARGGTPARGAVAAVGPAPRGPLPVWAEQFSSRMARIDRSTPEGRAQLERLLLEFSDEAAWRSGLGYASGVHPRAVVLHEGRAPGSLRGYYDAPKNEIHLWSADLATVLEESGHCAQAWELSLLSRLQPRAFRQALADGVADWVRPGAIARDRHGIYRDDIPALADAQLGEVRELLRLYLPRQDPATAAAQLPPELEGELARIAQRRLPSAPPAERAALAAELKGIYQAMARLYGEAAVSGVIAESAMTPGMRQELARRAERERRNPGSGMSEGERLFAGAMAHAAVQNQQALDSDGVALLPHVFNFAELHVLGQVNAFFGRAEHPFHAALRGYMIDMANFRMAKDKGDELYAGRFAVLARDGLQSLTSLLAQGEDQLPAQLRDGARAQLRADARELREWWEARHGR